MINCFWTDFQNAWYNIISPYFSLNIVPLTKGTIMGKNSKPKYSSGTVNINGQTKATTSKYGDNVTTNYIMSADEKKAYDYAQKAFAENLASANVFDSDTRKSINSQLEAYAKKGTKAINDIYNPMIDDTKNDIAKRFGNLDNSSFLNSLDAIESNRSDAVSSLGQDLVLMQNDLTNDELSRRYNYLSFLDGYVNNINSNAMSYGNMAQSNSNAGTAFNSGYSSSGTNWGNTSNLMAQIGTQILRSYINR